MSPLGGPSWEWVGPGREDAMTGRTEYERVRCIPGAAGAPRTYSVGGGLLVESPDPGAPWVALLAGLFEAGGGGGGSSSDGPGAVGEGSSGEGGEGGSGRDPAQAMRCTLRWVNSFEQSARDYADTGFLRAHGVRPERGEHFLSDMLARAGSNSVAVIAGRAFLARTPGELAALRAAPPPGFASGDTVVLVRSFYRELRFPPVVRPLAAGELREPARVRACGPEWRWAGRAEPDADRAVDQFQRAELVQEGAPARQVAVGDAVLAADRPGRSPRGRRIGFVLEMFAKSGEGPHADGSNMWCTLRTLRPLADIAAAVLREQDVRAVPDEICLTDVVDRQKSPLSAVRGRLFLVPSPTDAAVRPSGFTDGDEVRVLRYFYSRKTGAAVLRPLMVDEARSPEEIFGEESD